MLKSVEHVYHCIILEPESSWRRYSVSLHDLLHVYSVYLQYSGLSPDYISEVDKVVLVNLVALTWKNLIMMCYILRAPFLICFISPHYFVGLVSVGDLVLLLEIEWE